MNFFIPSIEEIEKEKNENSSNSLQWKQLKQATTEKLVSIPKNDSAEPLKSINPSNNSNFNSGFRPAGEIVINKNLLSTNTNPITSPSLRPTNEIVRLGKRIQIPFKPSFSPSTSTTVSSEILTEKTTETTFENEKITHKSTEIINQKVTITTNQNPKNIIERFPESPVAQKAKQWQDNQSNKSGCSLVISERQV